MTYARSITARLLDFDGTVVAGTPLANAFGITFYDEEDGPGTGSCSLPLSDAGASDLVPGRYVDIQVEGTSRFTFKIEGNPQYLVIKQAGESQEIIVINGRGWGCVLDEAITYPEFDRKFVIETTWRLFSFASELFPNSAGWLPAVGYAEYLEGVSTVDCYGHAEIADDGEAYPAPIGFPWCTNPSNLEFGVKTANYEDTYWLRPSATLMPGYADAGYYFFRNTFTLASPAACKFAVTGDNYFTLFLNGVPILGEEITGDHWMWKGWKEHEMWLPTGTYTIAAVVYNISFTDLTGGTVVQPACAAESFAGGARDGNVGGLLCVAFDESDLTVAPTHIISSDTSWDSWFEEDTWPGWTPGQIIQQLINEATDVSRGCMEVYSSNTFTATLDSNSDVWRPYAAAVTTDQIPSFAMEVGSTLMAALDQMVEQGYAHWHVQPGTFVLDMYRGRPPSSPSSAATLDTTNLQALERTATELYANSLMVQWSGGYVVVEDSSAITAYGSRVEDVFASDAPTEGEAETEGELELARRAQASFPAIAAVVEPSSASDCPYEAFSTGDYVTVPAVGGGTEVVRVLSIAASQDAEGYAIWTLELNRKLKIPASDNEELLRQIGGRSKKIRGTVN